VLVASVRTYFLLLGTYGVGRSSDGPLDVLRDNGNLCSRRRSSMSAHDAVATLSVPMQPSADSADSCVMDFVIEKDAADTFDVRRDSSAMQSVHEVSRRSSPAVDLSCSVVETMSRNHCAKTQTTRRKSLNETAMTDFSVAGLHFSGVSDSSESCQRSAWRRTKSYDMSGYELTVL